MKRRYQPCTCLLLLVYLMITGCRKDNEQINQRVAIEVKRSKDDDKSLKQHLDDLRNARDDKHFK